ncbi:MAG: Peptidase protein [Patescibacteria group bacterium]|nr:Peptidase protein [Patescibacteria group bacterium]
MRRNTKSLLLRSVFLAFSGILIVSAVLVRADSSITELSAAEEKALKEKQDRLDEIRDKIKAYNKIIDLKQRQGSALQTQIESLEARANKLELEVGQNQDRINQLKNDIGSLQARIDEKERIILSQRRLLIEMLRDASGVTETGLVRLVLELPSEAGFSLKNEEWTTQTNGRLSALLAEIRAAKQNIENEQALVLHKKSEADTLQEQLDKQTEYLESTKGSKASMLSKTQTEVKKYNSIVDQLEEERDAIENEIESLESTKIGELNLKDMPAFKKGLLEYPVSKIVFSQAYGKTAFAKKSKFYGKSGFHNGLDFAMPVGTKVLAAADGKVIATGNNGRYAYGRWMAVDHGNGIVTMYGHLSSISKSKGSSVKKGDTIAKSGNTGNSTGPHLHFTVFSAKSFEIVPSKSVASVRDIPVGATVNPKNYLP